MLHLPDRCGVVGTVGKKVASAAATGILDVCPAWRIPMHLASVFRVVRYVSLVFVLAVTREVKSTRCLNSSLVGSLDREPMK